MLNTSYHPREQETAEDRILGKLLPPVDFQPYDHNGRLKDDSLTAVENAIEKSLAVRDYMGKAFPDTAIIFAVTENFRERFQSATAVCEKFYDDKQFGDSLRTVFDLHTHNDPGVAMIFFKEHPKLFALDLAATVYSSDTRDISMEIIRMTSYHFRDMETVMNDAARVKIQTVPSADSEIACSLVTVKKIIAQDPEGEYRMKRRKSYLVSASVTTGDQVEIVHAIEQIFSGNHPTPEEFYPVIESVYVERGSLGNVDSLVINKKLAEAAHTQ